MEKLILSLLWVAAGNITEHAALYSRRYAVAYYARHQIAKEFDLMTGCWAPTGSRIEDRDPNRRLWLLDT